MSSSGREISVALPGAAPGAVAALDFFPHETRAVTACRNSDGTWRILGVGTAPSEGIEAGCVTHVSDAAETVAAALRDAERAAGRAPQSVFYTLHDPAAVFKKFRASRPLAGEGQVRPSDVRAAFSAAQRLAGDFETVNVYSTGLGFVIDDQDPIADPVGVFGRKLEIEAGFLQFHSQTIAVWRNVMKRAFCPPAHGVPLPQAVVLGALGAEPDRQRRAVLFERGGETIVCRTLGASIESCEAGSVKTPASLASAGFHEILVAGDNAERTVERLSRETASTARAARPETVAGLHAPQDVPTAGLLAAARERERMRLNSRHGHGLARKVRRKLAAFWSDYF